MKLFQLIPLIHFDECIQCDLAIKELIRLNFPDFRLQQPSLVHGDKKLYKALSVYPDQNSSVAAVVSCFCFIIVAAVIVVGLGALFLLFVLLYSQRVASQSCETLGELLHHPTRIHDRVEFIKKATIMYAKLL